MAAASSRAMLALQAADEARRACHSTVGTSGLTSSADDTNSSSGSRWQEVQSLTVEAVEHMVSALSAEGLHSGIQTSCTAALAPSAAELSFLAALQGQQEAQARLDRLFAESWRLQAPPAYLGSACRGCRLLQMLRPEATRSSGEGRAACWSAGRVGSSWPSLQQTAPSSRCRSRGALRAEAERTCWPQPSCREKVPALYACPTTTAGC